MDWLTPLLSLAGAAVGGGGIATYIELHRRQREGVAAQLWRDAEMLADVSELARDLEPKHRGINVNPAAFTEEAADINARARVVSKQLIRLATGHPSATFATRQGT